MKKIILASFVTVFMLTQSFGQIDLGVKAGINLANIKNIGPTDNKARSGINAGLFTEIGISRKFIARPELLYSTKGYRFPARALNGAGTLSLHYISIPVLAGFRPVDHLTVLVGPEFNYMTAARSAFDGTIHDVSKNFRKFDPAIDLGVAYKIKNGLGAELRYSYGFDDLTDVMYTDQFGAETGKGRAGSNRVLQLGILYKFSKK